MIHKKNLFFLILIIICFTSCSSKKHNYPTEFKNTEGKITLNLNDNSVITQSFKNGKLTNLSKSTNNFLSDTLLQTPNGYKLNSFHLNGKKKGEFKLSNKLSKVFSQMWFANGVENKKDTITINYEQTILEYDSLKRVIHLNKTTQIDTLDEFYDDETLCLKTIKTSSKTDTIINNSICSTPVFRSKRKIMDVLKNVKKTLPIYSGFLRKGYNKKITIRVRITIYKAGNVSLTIPMAVEPTTPIGMIKALQDEILTWEFTPSLHSTTLTVPFKYSP